MTRTMLSRDSHESNASGTQRKPRDAEKWREVVLILNPGSGDLMNCVPLTFAKFCSSVGRCTSSTALWTRIGNN